MNEEKEVSEEGAHEVCHNPCTACNNKGYLDNEELCPVCAGTGCRDKKYCAPAGGLGCNS
jgi:hypothetical protein